MIIDLHGLSLIDTYTSMSGLAHPGVKTTLRVVANKFVWQNGTWAKQCIACQNSKIQRHVRAPLHTSTEVPSRRFQHIRYRQTPSIIIGIYSPSHYR